MSRFVIGIDLGTTNSCVFYVDTRAEGLRIQHFKIPQLNAHGHLEHLPTLPSFYLKGEYPLPWDKHRKFVVGQRALSEGERLPTQLVQSAKSWLCHSAADRKNKILPSEAPSENDRISPVEASARYLSHIREGWNHTFAKGDPEAFFEEQEVVLTVPASFDEGARTLTLEAAKEAGFRNVTLLEEPQAAFYAWIGKNPTHIFPEGTQVLVADVGGGTTDFSLIGYEKGSYVRQVVGDHLLLGGDNIDHAIAHHIIGKLNKGDLPLTQWLQLKHESRRAKEAIYSDRESYKLYLQGGGSKVIAGGQSFEIGKTEMDQLVLDGFFPRLSWSEARKLHRKSALSSMGLPYESDPAITKHLAAFYHSHFPKTVKGPDYVLFNGGSFKPEPFRNAVLESLRSWFPESKAEELPSHNLDLAVGYGACYYGLVRRGLGVKIRGGSARAFYLEVDAGSGKHHALTVLPRGEEEGYSYTLPHEFFLRANSALRFQLYSSHVRIHDAVGSFVEIDPLEMHPLPPIQTQLRYGKGDQFQIPVHVEIELTPLGTLALQLRSKDTNHVWKLEFQLKSASGQEDALLGVGEARREEMLDQIQIESLKNIIQEYFSKGETPKPFFEPLESELGSLKTDWPVSILRTLADAVIDAAPLRLKKTKLRHRWWNAIGFFLRPGFGYPLDDFRVKALWKCFLEDRSVLDSDEQIQLWIALRRVCGGLSRGQQQQVAAEVLPMLAEKIKTGRDEYIHSERIRLLASLEWLDRSVKLKLGTALANKIVAEKGTPADFWALGRLGARELLYSPLSCVLPATDVSRWIERLIETRQIERKSLVLLLGQLARKTDYREINIADVLVKAILDQIEDPQLAELLQRVCAVTREEKELQYGEGLPPGLSQDRPG